MLDYCFYRVLCGFAVLFVLPLWRIKSDGDDDDDDDL